MILGAFHTKGLARARLAIGKDAHIVTIEDARHQRLHLGKHLLLCGLRPKAVVEFKSLFTAFAVVEHRDAVIVEVRPFVLEEDGIFAPRAALVLELRTHARKYADVALELEHHVVQTLALFFGGFELVLPALSEQAHVTGRATHVTGLVARATGPGNALCRALAYDIAY